MTLAAAPFLLSHGRHPPSPSSPPFFSFFPPPSFSFPSFLLLLFSPWPSSLLPVPSGNRRSPKRDGEPGAGSVVFKGMARQCRGKTSGGHPSPAAHKGSGVVSIRRRRARAKGAGVRARPTFPLGGTSWKRDTTIAAPVVRASVARCARLGPRTCNARAGERGREDEQGRLGAGEGTGGRAAGLAQLGYAVCWAGSGLIVEAGVRA